MSKFEQVSKSKYRTVISDILPYERPAFFSNRFFARFLKYYGIKTKDGELIATKHKNEEGLTDFLHLLGGENGDERPCFQYSIVRPGKKQGRLLAIIHPYHQVKMVEFYERYASLVLAFCQRSDSSLRHPFSVATFQIRESDTDNVLSDDIHPYDTTNRLKHYFAYRPYDNISHFFGDYRFLRAEKQFSRMKKMDLKECFENIHPEDLSKALFDLPIERATGSLAEEFCKLQKEFKNIKSGIVIGPEFSRVFAEMVLQKVDIGLEQSLRKLGVEKYRDYLFYRYVDDGFLFYNDPKVSKKFFKAYTTILNKYHQTIHKDKCVDFDQRPFVEPLAAIKEKLQRWVDEMFENRLDTFKGFMHIQQDTYDIPLQIDYRRFINRVRTAMVTDEADNNVNHVSYDKLMPFLLGCIQSKTDKLLYDFNRLYKEYYKADLELDISDEGQKIYATYRTGFLTFAVEIIQILFFLLASDFRMSTSIKIVQMIDKLQRYVRGRYYFVSLNEYSPKFSSQFINQFDAQITKETIDFLKCRSSITGCMEALNLLELQKIMAKSERVSQKILLDYLGYKNDKGIITPLNFFTATELLHFAEDDSSYQEIRNIVYDWMDGKLDKLMLSGMSDTESVLVLIEILCCPYIDIDKYQEWSIKLSSSHFQAMQRFASWRRDMFVKWQGYNLQEEMQIMNSSEVYG